MLPILQQNVISPRYPEFLADSMLEQQLYLIFDHYYKTAEHISIPANIADTLHEKTDFEKFLFHMLEFRQPASIRTRESIASDEVNRNIQFLIDEFHANSIVTSINETQSLTFNKSDHPEGPIHRPAGPTQLPNRRAGMVWVGASLEDRMNINSTFIKFDLSNLRFFDYVKDSKGGNSADYAINLVARVLNTTVTALNKYLRLQNGASASIGFRYGGDEFVIAINGINDPQLVNFINKFIAHKIGQKSAFRVNRPDYRPEEITTEQLQITSEIIRFPEDLALQKIAIEYAERGLLLNERELLKVQNNGHVSLGAEEAETYAELLDNLELLDDENIEQFYPEFARHKDAFKIIVEGLNLDDNQKKYVSEIFIKAIKQKYFDSLLRIRAYEINDLFEMSQSGKLFAFICTDVKGIKEINTWVAYSVGDEARLASMLKKINLIKARIGGVKNLSKHLVIVPRGGTCLLAILKSGDEKLDRELFDLLNNDDDVILHEKYQHEGKEYLEEVAVVTGNYAEIIASDKPLPNNLKEFSEYIGKQVIDRTEENWYDKAIYKFNSLNLGVNIRDFINQRQMLFMDHELRFAELMQFGQLLRHFVHGKRYEERSQKFLSRLSFRRAA